MFSSPIRLLFCILVVAAGAIPVPALATWNEGSVVKEHLFNQSDSAPPVEGSSPFRFVGTVRNTVPDQTGAIVLPLGAPYTPNPMTVVNAGLLVGAHYQYVVPYSSPAALEEDFPNGTYTFNISRTYSSGSTTTLAQPVVLTGTLGFPQSVPTITNGTWQNGVLLLDPNNPVLTWDAWPGAPASARVELEMYANNGAGGATMSPGSTSLTWSGLQQNTVYHATLTFLNVEDDQTFVDTNASDQDLGFRASYAVSTTFDVILAPDTIWPTAGTQPSYPRLYSISATPTQVVAVGENGRIATLSLASGNWTTANSPANRTLYAVTSGTGKYVAVGASGTIRSSADGVVWTDRTSPTTSDLRTVIWTGSQFVAGGASGVVLTSPDGVSWTKRTTNVSYTFGGIAYSGGIYVAASNSGIRVSNDAITWRSPRSSAGASGQAVTWTGTQFILGRDQSGFFGALYKSADGETWSRDFSWDQSVTRLVTSNGVTYMAGSTFMSEGSVQRTTDGNNWTSLKGETSPALRDITWNGQALVLLDSANNVLVGSGIAYEIVQFTSAGYTVSEGAATANVGVSRLGVTSWSTTVAFNTANGSAFAGSDYTASSGTVTFAAGETTKTISVPLLNDALIEDDEVFAVALDTPSGSATLGNPSSTTITIVDDDPRPVFQFALSSYAASESTGYVDLTVTRTWDTLPASTVDYATFNGSGIAGRDYQSSSGTLFFASGEIAKTIRINLTNDLDFQWPRAFSVQLKNPAPLSSLGSIASTTVNLSNDDPAPAGLVILEATYGASGTTANVLSYVAAQISNDTVSMTASNSSLGGDPISGKVKTLYVRYQNASGHFQTSVQEGSLLRIPDAGAQRLPMEFSQWATTKFTSNEISDPLISGSGGDLDGDGIPNLMEYALGMEPKASSLNGLPQVAISASGSDQFLTLSYTPNGDATGVSYVVQVGSDLSHWDSGSTFTEQLSGQGEVPVLVKDKTPISQSQRRFIRLQVIRN